MNISIKRTKAKLDNDIVAVLINKSSSLSSLKLSKPESAFVKSQIKNKLNFIQLNSNSGYLLLIVVENTDTPKYNESLRKMGHQIYGFAKRTKFDSVFLQNLSKNNDAITLVAEGVALSNYRFGKYAAKRDDLKAPLKSLKIDAESSVKGKVDELNNIIGSVYSTRDLVNEPLSFLDSVTLSKEIKRIGKKAGFKVEVFDKKKIESLKMGGLLAVNFGSPTPPTFSIMEWKPKNAKNKKPIVLVGKGVVYDTGGLSLKPTANSMDMMKCDMAGAACVIGTFEAIATNKLPIHVIGLIPSTDNRPGQNAYVPGDIVKMHNGLNVEVLNTDAEGRMLLADALSYAQKYKPEFVFDFATLTGASARACGPFATAVMEVGMQSKVKEQVMESSFEVHERMIEFPMWEDYGQMIKSDIADIKNVGGPYAGMITAGKFLENFVDYPWMHFDIAGASYIMKEDGYRGKYGTGVGVRLMYNFFKKYCKK